MSPFPREDPILVRAGMIGGKVKALVVTRSPDINRTARHFIFVVFVVGGNLKASSMFDRRQKREGQVVG